MRQEKKLEPAELALLLFKSYRGTGLKGFCEKHGINYNSARKVYNGSAEYPGIEIAMLEAMEKDQVPA